MTDPFWDHAAHFIVILVPPALILMFSSWWQQRPIRRTDVLIVGIAALGAIILLRWLGMEP